MYPHVSLLVVTALMGCVMASCASKELNYKTPVGRLVIDHSRRDGHEHVELSGKLSISSSAVAPHQMRRYGFARGSGVDQVHASSLVLQIAQRKLAIPEPMTRDLWNLDFGTARVSETCRMTGLEGYAVQGGDGERGYTVIFFYRGDQCVGRVVSTLLEDVFQSVQGERMVLRTWHPPKPVMNRLPHFATS